MFDLNIFIGRGSINTINMDIKIDFRTFDLIGFFVIWKSYNHLVASNQPLAMLYIHKKVNIIFTVERKNHYCMQHFPYADK